MVKIRLRRVGAKKQPHYRVVVTDSRSPRDGKFLETIGNYNPRTEPPTIEIDAERAIYWLGVGAQPSEAVKRMLDKLGISARAEAIKRGEAPPEIEPVVKEVEAEVEELVLEEAAVAAGFEPLEAESDVVDDEDEDEDEDEDLEEDLLDSEDELDDQEDDWDSDISEDEDVDDLDDDWDLDVDDDDDGDDEPLDEDDD
jgi:small subunit ribosomal protein S16